MKVYLVWYKVDCLFLENTKIELKKIFRTRESAEMYISKQRSPYRYFIREVEVEE